MNQQNLKFKGGNPGAVQYGNFINYYQFHPPESRLKLFPTDIFTKNVKTFYGLDVGCNAGDLTMAVYNLLKGKVEQCHILGVDIDPTLIERAKEKVKDKNNLTFYCLDFMNEDHKRLITNFLGEQNLHKFDAVFCFSITMWIHLNYGDNGLIHFLQELCRLGNIIVLEPQPWKCYRSAVKRVKSCNGHFPLYKSLQIRQTVEEYIEHYLTEKCKMIKIFKSIPTEWGRRLIIFKCLSS